MNFIGVLLGSGNFSHSDGSWLGSNYLIPHDSMKLLSIPKICVLVLLLHVCSAHGGESLAESMSRAADAWLGSLSDQQKERALYEFNDDRKDWHFIPKDREAISLSEMKVAPIGI